MKLAFCGAGGTGKTTLAKLIQERYLADHVLLPSASRTTFEVKGLTEELEKAMTPAALWDLQLEIFRAKMGLDADHEDFVADRSLLDHWAYCLVQARDGMTARQARDWEAVTKQWMGRTYDHVVYCPIEEFWNGEDPSGIRSAHYPYQVLIDSVIRSYLERWGWTGVLRAPGMELDERAGWIWDSLPGSLEG
jgi:hypothetical protein